MAADGSMTAGLQGDRQQQQGDVSPGVLMSPGTFLKSMAHIVSAATASMRLGAGHPSPMSAPAPMTAAAAAAAAAVAAMHAPLSAATASAALPGMRAPPPLPLAAQVAPGLGFAGLANLRGLGGADPHPHPHPHRSPTSSDGQRGATESPVSSMGRARDDSACSCPTAAGTPAATDPASPWRRLWHRRRQSLPAPPSSLEHSPPSALEELTIVDDGRLHVAPMFYRDDADDGGMQELSAWLVWCGTCIMVLAAGIYLSDCF